MNSTATHQRTVEIIREQRKESTLLLGYLQNDRAGLHVAKKLRDALPELQLENQRYLRYGDLNDYLMNAPLKEKDYASAQKFLQVHFGGGSSERKVSTPSKKL